MLSCLTGLVCVGVLSCLTGLVGVGVITVLLVCWCQCDNCLTGLVGVGVLSCLTGLVGVGVITVLLVWLVSVCRLQRYMSLSCAMSMVLSPLRCFTVRPSSLPIPITCNIIIIKVTKGVCVAGGYLSANTACDTDHLQHVRKVTIKGVCRGWGGQRKQLLADTDQLQTSHQGKKKKKN